MSFLDFFKRKPDSQKRSIGWFTTTDAYDMLCSSEYTSLDKNPEIFTACRKIAELISSMTLYLMANTEKGDVRIVNELSRQVDILPSPWMTRKTWMEYIVMQMILTGRGNSVVLPHTSGGMLQELEPIAATRTGFQPDGRGYYVMIDGRRFSPDDLLHFVYNPDPIYPWLGRGLTVQLKEVAENLKQASVTKKGFMESKWKPSLIIKVDALTEEFASKEGRQKLLDEYVKTASAGEPMMIPAEQFSVEQIKPLSLTDLAITDAVKMDKQTVAAVLGVPAFLLGVGDYNADEWNGFINNTIRPIAREIEQELTRKLLISPKMYWKFNMASLYSYDLQTTQTVYSELYVRGIVTGNEVRDKLSMEPKDGLDDLVILENYIPLAKIGDQVKLGQEGDE